LALSRRLATALGGDITVSSREGQGSTFTLSINIDPPATEAVASVRKAEDQRRVQGSGTDAPQRMVRRVLLVEDDRDVQRLVLHLLQKLEIEADLAENGEIACQRARHALSAGRPYELILMDVEMPVMNGLDATRRLRREGWTGPIIALTAHAMSGDREMCRAASCDDYVPKPISRDALQAVLLRHLRLASTAAALATAYREARKPDESVDAGLAVAN
jgi:CheY-like chemotaxis protein